MSGKALWKIYNLYRPGWKEFWAKRLKEFMMEVCKP